MEYDQTLNQLLVEMDGLTTQEDISILIIGATNRPDLLDQPYYGQVVLIGKLR